MHDEYSVVAARLVHDGRSRRNALAALLSGIVGLIGMHKDNPTHFVGMHKDNPTRGRISAPERPVDRVTD